MTRQKRENQGFWAKNELLPPLSARMSTRERGRRSGSIGLSEKNLQMIKKKTINILV
jgi:hypothetical protein